MGITTMRDKVLEAENWGDITGLEANVILGHLVKFNLLDKPLDIKLLNKIISNMKLMLEPK